MITRFEDVSAEEFREAGMLCIVNVFLSMFGFALVQEGDDTKLSIGRVNPLDSEPEYVKEGLEKTVQYLSKNLSYIYKDDDKNAYLKFDITNPISDSNLAIAQRRIKKLIEYLQNTPIDKMPTSIILPDLTGEWESY